MSRLLCNPRRRCCSAPWRAAAGPAPPQALRAGPECPGAAGCAADASSRERCCSAGAGAAPASAGPAAMPEAAATLASPAAAGCASGARARCMASPSRALSSLSSLMRRRFCSTRAWVRCSRWCASATSDCSSTSCRLSAAAGRRAQLSGAVLCVCVCWGRGPGGQAQGKWLPLHAEQQHVLQHGPFQEDGSPFLRLASHGSRHSLCYIHCFPVDF